MIRSRRPQTSQPYAHVKSRLRRICLRILDVFDLIVYVLVGAAFLCAAGLALFFSLVHLVYSLIPGFPINFYLESNVEQAQAIQTVLNFVSDLLLILIIMEVLGTIRSYIEKGDSSVTPFLFIGIISATRGILSIGARLSIPDPPLTPDEFRNAMIELAIDAVVIILLGATVRILGKAAVMSEENRDDGATAGAVSLAASAAVDDGIPAA